MCRSGNHIFNHEDLNPAHFSDQLKNNHENRNIGP